MTRIEVVPQEQPYAPCRLYHLEIYSESMHNFYGTHQLFRDCLDLLEIITGRDEYFTMEEL